MTPDEVHTVAFRKAPFGHRGYDEQAVDEVLDRIQDTLGGRPRITRDEVGALRFRKPPIGLRGYDRDEVDAFIGRVIAEWPAYP